MKPKNIDEYIALQPSEFRGILEEMRSIIKSAAPKAEETISYMVPTFKYKGPLVGFGTNKKGCSFYPMSGSILNSYIEELKNYKGTKGAVHFELNKKLPVTLIKKITKQRLKQNEEKERFKSKKLSLKK